MGLDHYIIGRRPGAEKFETLTMFRKVNSLHGYFDTRYNMGNPGLVPLTKYVIEDILNRTEMVLEDISHATEQFPSYPGPFFGHYSYDSFYLEMIQEVHNAFQNALDCYDDFEELCYGADY